MTKCQHFIKRVDVKSLKLCVFTEIGILFWQEIADKGVFFDSENTDGIREEGGGVSGVPLPQYQSHSPALLYQVTSHPSGERAAILTDPTAHAPPVSFRSRDQRDST